jgi:hypothetical protein
MANASPAAASAFRADLLALPQEIADGVTDKRAKAQREHWKIWVTFCEDSNLDPSLFYLRDPIPVMQVFMRRFRDGRLAPSRQQVSARHAEDALRSVGQTLAQLGAGDYRKDPRTGRLDFRLARQQNGYRKRDRPAPKKLPIPKAVLLQILLWSGNGPREAALADLTWLAFFFLLRPGEYVWTNSNPHPFTLKDVFFKIGTIRYRADTVPLDLIHLVSYVGLSFTEQKNGIKNELIGLTRSRDIQACPVLAVIRRVRHLRDNHADADTPLYTFFLQGKTHRVTDRMMTAHLRLAGIAVNQPADYTVGALRNTGAQSLLQGSVPLPLIKLLGRWRSDEVFRYLTANSEQLMGPFARSMLQNAST